MADRHDFSSLLLELTIESMMNIRKTTHLLLLPLLAVLISCSSDERSEGTTNDDILSVRHHYITGFTLQPVIVNSVARGNDEFHPFYNLIHGFTYEHGYDYVLRVNVTEIPNPPADAPSLRYDLEEVLSKTPGSTSEQFRMILRVNYDTGGEMSFLTGDIDSGFKLLDQVPVNCGSLCDDLQAPFDTDLMYGVFQRNDNNSYELIDITFEDW